jgi:hypothetical protein
MSRTLQIRFAIYSSAARPLQAMLVVADRWGVDDANALIIHLPPARVVEETSAITQEHGNDMDFHFVNQAGLQVLLGDIRAAPPR